VQQSNKWLFWGMGLVFAFILIQKVFIVYTDFLWYQALGQPAVFTTILRSRVFLGAVVGGLFFLWFYANLRLARKPLPEDLTLIGKRLLPTEEREQIEHFAEKALLVFAVTGALMAALVASGKWREWLQFTHMVPFGQADAIFGRDAGFYVFRLSFLNYVWQSLFYALVITFVASVVVHIYQEAIRLVGNQVHATAHARFHCLSLLGLALLTKAYMYRLAQYGLLYSTGGEAFSGPSYADVHGRIPVMYGLMVLAVAAALVMFVSIPRKKLNLAAWALGIVLVASVIGGSIYPAALQTLVVKPNQLERERPYIANNIAASIQAYGLDQVRAERHVIREDLNWPDINRNRATVDNIRLWDHRPLETTFQQTQALRAYYRFSDVDVDRYTVEGRYRQVMLAGRELDYGGLTQPNWVSQHLLYTHGYGLCLAPVNEISGDGLPNYWVKDFPPKSSVGLDVSRPQLYYYASRHPRLIEYISPPEQPDDTVAPAAPAPAPSGPPGAPGPNDQAQRQQQAGRERPALADVSYVISNSKEWEFDYPKTSAADAKASDQDNSVTRYTGKGDVQLNSFWRRFAFFMRFRDLQILLTNSITPESRIMFNRALPERLMVFAPFLGYDPDPYLVIAKDGNLKWFCDAYTASNMYPYSWRTPWFGANYVRNSVKVVMDAYDGIPQFYVVPPRAGQKADPIIQCWRECFPGLFKDLRDLDPDLRTHVRYPQLMFRIQAEAYGRYHMKDAQTFFQKEDLWAIPPEIYGKGRREVEAYYVNMELPSEGSTKAEFLLMLPFTLAKAEEKNMVAWMAARCDGDNYGDLVVYDFPKSSLVQGPMQVESRISQDSEISQLITLWGQQQSRIIRGNLLVIPIESSLLYVEPFYLEAPNSPLPQLKLVVMAYNDKIVNAPTLGEALRKMFGGGEDKTAGSQPPPSSEVAAGTLGVKAVLQRALDLENEAQKALATGDLATYQAKQKEQAQMLQKALQTIP
jgi:uncharacterized protein